jgi:osmotically-inducible protein OsmY
MDDRNDMSDRYSNRETRYRRDSDERMSGRMRRDRPGSEQDFASRSAYGGGRDGYQRDYDDDGRADRSAYGSGRGYGGGYDRGYGAPDRGRRPLRGDYDDRWESSAGYGTRGGGMGGRVYDDRWENDLGHGPGAGHYGGTGYYAGTGYDPRFDDDRRYGAHDYRRRIGDDDRGFMDKAADEVQSWFGDDDARRRREADHRGRGPKNYTRADDRIRDDVNDALTDDSMLDASGIEVKVSNGEVTLSGHVASKQAKRRAEDCADDISGVKHVQNNLRVKSSDDFGASSTTAGKSTA